MKNPDGIRIDGVFYIPTRSRSDDVCETCDIKWFCGMYEKTNFPCEMFAKADNKIHFKKRSRNKKKEKIQCATTERWESYVRSRAMRST